MDEVQSLARGLMIIDIIAASQNSVGITELSQRLQIDKSTASRLVQTLANYGWVERDDAGRRYRIGPKFSPFSQNSPLNHERIRLLARPVLIQLVAQTGECAHIAVPMLGGVYVIDDVETDALLRVVSGVGRTTQLHCTALGKVLLAFGYLDLPRELTRFTTRTITDYQQLEDELAHVRAQGFAVDDEELTEGVRCIAAPIQNFAGDCVAAIGISGPAVRVTADRVARFAEIVVCAGAELSKALKFNLVPSIKP
jgi:DNA-binding IclR family transcriptional regulator